jgi:antitoxin FitA
MAILQIENLPDEIYRGIQSLAAEHNFTLNEAAIYLLKQAFHLDEVKTSRDRQPQMSEVLQRIRSRSRVNPIDFGLQDSTVLIREDRSR